VKDKHPNWAVISVDEMSWGAGTYLHFTSGGFSEGSKKVRTPHFSIRDTSVENCCGAIYQSISYDMAEPDFFEKLSKMIILNEEAEDAERK
jgi:hypothetical protein